MRLRAQSDGRCISGMAVQMWASDIARARSCVRPTLVPEMSACMLAVCGWPQIAREAAPPFLFDPEMKSI